MRSNLRHHFLPPSGPTVPVLESQHLRAGLHWWFACAVGTTVVAWLAGLLTLSHVMAAPIAVAAAGQAVRAGFDAGGRLTLDRGSWWGVVNRAVLIGAGCATIGVVAIVALGNVGVGGVGVGGSILLKVAVALLSNSVMAPAATVLLLARMRDEHAKQYPLTGADGELEA